MSEDVPVTLKAIAAADGVNASITVGAPINKTYTGVIAGSQVVIVIPAVDVVLATVMPYTSTAEGSVKTVSGNFIIDDTAESVISNLQITGITQTQATIVFDIDPILDCVVEIDDGTGFVALANTGQFASHSYAIHNQTALTADTSYVVRITPVGEPALTIGFDTIEAGQATWVSISDSDWQTTGIDRSTLSSDWTGESGFVSDGGNTDAYKVVVPYDENYGVSKYFEGLPTKSQDVEFKYRVLVVNANYGQQDSNTKFPGPNGKVSTLNGGYGGSQGTYLDPDYRAPSFRKQLHRPHSSYQDYALGAEKYWQGSSNGPNGNNPQGQPKYNGDSKWDSANGAISGSDLRFLTPGTWSEINVRMVMNTPNVADGAIYNYVDGQAGYTETGIEWVKPFANFQQFVTQGKLTDWADQYEMFQVYRLWFDVYHGGGDKVTTGDLVFFFRDFQYKVNV